MVYEIDLCIEEIEEQIYSKFRESSDGDREPQRTVRFMWRAVFVLPPPTIHIILLLLGITGTRTPAERTRNRPDSREPPVGRSDCNSIFMTKIWYYIIRSTYYTASTPPEYVVFKSLSFETSLRIHSSTQCYALLQVRQVHIRFTLIWVRFKNVWGPRNVAPSTPYFGTTYLAKHNDGGAHNIFLTFFYLYVQLS